MLTIQPATASLDPPHKKSKIALAIAGGGPLGGIYKIGALHALDEAIEGVRLNELDIYVGVSSGAFLAASLANRLDTSQMYRIFIQSESTEHPFRPEMFLKPAFREYLSRAKHIPSALIEAIQTFARKPLRFPLLESLSAFSKVIPSGFFDNDVIDHFLKGIYCVPGRTNDFKKLDSELYIVAVDLDSGGAVRFGSDQFDHHPISKAVQASAALPGLFPPVEIDGRYYLDGALRRTLHASVALDAEADLVFAINPLVPFNSQQNNQSDPLSRASLIEGGLPAILSQTFRAIIQSRMQIGMEKYDSHYAKADLVLLEPNRDDEKMFFTNVFSYSNRKKVCEHAYQRTRQDLLLNSAKINNVLSKHGLELNLDILNDTQRTMTRSLNKTSKTTNTISNRLQTTLADLQNAITLRHEV